MGGCDASRYSVACVAKSAGVLTACSGPAGLDPFVAQGRHAAARVDSAVNSGLRPEVTHHMRPLAPLVAILGLVVLTASAQQPPLADSGQTFRAGDRKSVV